MNTNEGLQNSHQITEFNLQAPQKVELKRQRSFLCSIIIICFFTTFAWWIYSTFSKQESPDKRSLNQKRYKDVSELKNEDLSLNLNNHRLGEDHTHELFVLPYKTLGMLIIGKPFDIEPICYQQYYEYQMNQDQLFRPYLEHDCKHERFGNLSGTGYVLCENFLSQSQALLNFGIKGGDQFGCSIARSYPLKNYLTTCFGEKATACDKIAQQKTIESINCLSQIVQFNRQYTFTTLKEEIDSKGLKGKHIVLKLDIGRAAWMALKTLPIDYLRFIDQMIVVFHNPAYPEIQEIPKGYINIIDSLKSYFISVNVHMDNNHCIHNYEGSKHMRKYRSSALEVTLVNKNIINLRSDARGYQQLHSKNLINNIARLDCQMKFNQ